MISFYKKLVVHHLLFFKSLVGNLFLQRTKIHGQKSHSKLQQSCILHQQ